MNGPIRCNHKLFVCHRLGTTISKASKDWNRRIGTERHLLGVEVRPIAVAAASIGQNHGGNNACGQVCTSRQLGSSMLPSLQRAEMSCLDIYVALQRWEFGVNSVL